MADKAMQQSTGGQYNGAFTGGNVETLVYTGTGRLQAFAITTAGTASFSIYDGTQSTGGTLLFTSLTNDALGTVKACGFPFTNGLVFKGTTGAAGVCAFYNKSTSGSANGL